MTQGRVGDAPQAWAKALAIWGFLLFWTLGLGSSLFASACEKSGLAAEQRLYRCGWAWTLSAPFRAMGDPPSRYASGRMTVGIAQAELGNEPAAIAAFALALDLADAQSPLDLGNLRNLREPALRLLDRAADLPPDSAAARLFFAVAQGRAP